MCTCTSTRFVICTCRSTHSYSTYVADETSVFIVSLKVTTAHRSSAGAIACILMYYKSSAENENVGVIHLKSKMESMRMQTATDGAKISHETIVPLSG